MRLHKSLAVIATAVSLSHPVYAQQDAAKISSAVRAQVFELLTYQDGVGEAEDPFHASVAKLGPQTEKLLISVLAEGIPAEVRKSAEAHAASRFDRRQALLAESGQELLGSENRRVAERNREAYIADALRRLDRLYRENAVRALGIVGGPLATETLQATLRRDPDLARLAEQALAEIRKRQ